MKFLTFVLTLLISIPGALWAQSGSGKATDFRGHFIGENISDFLRLEPEAQQEADVCRQHPDQHSCERLIGALDHDGRAELSTTGSLNFVLDGGKLVELTMLVDDSLDSAAADLIGKFGKPSKGTVLPVHDSAGVQWQNRQYFWDTPNIYITLYQDNNPSAKDRRLILVVKSPAEHLLNDADQKKQPTSFASR